LNVGVSAAENPTVTIVPIQGKQFTERVLTPFEDTTFEFPVFQGVPIDMVMRLMADGIEVQTPEGTFAGLILNWATHPAEYEEFRRIALHLAWLNATRRLFVGRLSFLATTQARLSTPPHGDGGPAGLRERFPLAAGRQGWRLRLGAPLDGAGRHHQLRPTHAERRRAPGAQHARRGEPRELCPRRYPPRSSRRRPPLMRRSQAAQPQPDPE